MTYNISSGGSLLRAFRKANKLSQDELEQITNIKSTNISALENNKLQFTGHYADIFAAALGIHPRVLLYPNGEFNKSEDLKKIEERAQKIIKKKAV